MENMMHFHNLKYLENNDKESADLFVSYALGSDWSFWTVDILNLLLGAGTLFNGEN